MKIIEIATGYTPIPAKVGAATEIVVENLVKSFNSLHVVNELIDIRYSNQKHILAEDIEGSKIHKITLPKWLSKIEDKGIVHLIRRVLYSLKLGFYIKKYIKQQNNNGELLILHFHNQFNFFFTFIIARREIQKCNVKTLYTIHTPNWSHLNYIPKRLIVEKISIIKADIVISLTQVIKKNILELLKIDSDKIWVIKNGVNVNEYAPLLNVCKENTILNVGSICERKNQLGTIKAVMDFLVDENYRFVFAGKIIDNHYYNKILDFIDNYNLSKNVEYLGEVKPGVGLNKLYNSSMFYVSHSRQEAFSLVILESMAAGLPVILSSSFESFFDKDDNIRKAVKFVSDDKICSHLKMLSRNKFRYNQYIEKQLECINEYYTWDSIAKLMIDKLVDIKI